MQQAKDYAEILGLKFAYAPNGAEILEFDFLTGLETERTDFPTPAELWGRQRAGLGLTDDTAAERLLAPGFPDPARAAALLSRDRRQSRASGGSDRPASGAPHALHRRRQNGRGIPALSTA